MVWNRNKYIPKEEITKEVTDETVKFAKDFGEYLGSDFPGNRDTKLTTNQLRKFFGEVKRQQMSGYNKTDFVLLKPKLAYAVGRAKKKEAKIKDFYDVIANAIDNVSTPEDFKRFIKIFEAIVAYHKVAEENVVL